MSHLHVNYSRVSENNSRNFKRKSSKANSAQKSYLPKKRDSSLKKVFMKTPCFRCIQNLNIVEFSFHSWILHIFILLEIIAKTFLLQKFIICFFIVAKCICHQVRVLDTNEAFSFLISHKSDRIPSFFSAKLMDCLLGGKGG